MQHTKELYATVSKALWAELMLVASTQRLLTLDVLVRTLKVGRLTVVLRWEPILKPKMPNSISGKDINLY